MIRKPREEELFLITYLAKKAAITISKDIENSLLVSSMNDGGMGSLYLYPKGEKVTTSPLVRIASDCLFYDKDNVVVIATLYVDFNNNLAELDIWKTNYEQLFEIPTNPSVYTDINLNHDL